MERKTVSDHANVTDILEALSVLKIPSKFPYMDDTGKAHLSLDGEYVPVAWRSYNEIKTLRASLCPLFEHGKMLSFSL